MKTFREHLKEEVKLDSLYTGGIDISRDAVRDEINAVLTGMVSKPCVTPYGTLNKVRKALAYFAIHLPKRVYMEGNHGVEVWEVHQFGDKMGMTDQGEFIKSIPAKYYLFFHYHLIGSMYFVEAKIVDGDELEKKMDNMERMFAEGVDAAARQGVAKAVSPKEPMQDELGDGTEGTKKAVEVSMRRKDKKLSADKLDETHADNIRRKYRQKEDDNDHTGNVHLLTRVFGSKKERETSKGLLRKRNKQGYVTSSDSQKGYSMTKDYARRMEKLKEEELDETRMPASVIKHKQKLANMTPEEKAKKFAGKSEEELKSMARRHGYGKDSDVYSKHVKEEQIEELSKGTLKSYKSAAKADRKMSKEVIKKGLDTDGKFERSVKKRSKGIELAKDRLEEKAPPGAKFERMVKHIKKGYSKGGLTAKEKSIAYATAWKAKKKESSE